MEEMDAKEWPTGAAIETAKDGTWTLEDCIRWCNNRDDCVGFEFDRNPEYGPNGEIKDTIFFQGDVGMTPTESYVDKVFVKRHAYSGPQVARFVAKESWRNGSLDIPKYVSVRSYSKQPQEGPMLMQVRYQERDGKTMAPVPLVAQAHLEAGALRFYTECYGEGSSRWSEASAQSSQNGSCQSEQCFVSDYSSRGNSIEGADSIVSSAKLCQTACQKHHGCAYWTWYGTAANETKNSCVLKTKTNDQFTLQVGAVSGPRRCLKR